MAMSDYGQWRSALGGLGSIDTQAGLEKRVVMMHCRMS